MCCVSHGVERLASSTKASVAGSQAAVSLITTLTERVCSVAGQQQHEESGGGEEQARGCSMNNDDSCCSTVLQLAT